MKKMMGWLPIASKIASTKSKLIMVAALLILVIILVRLVWEANWHLYIQQAQTDPEKTAYYAKMWITSDYSRENFGYWLNQLLCYNPALIHLA